MNHIAFASANSFVNSKSTFDYHLEFANPYLQTGDPLFVESQDLVYLGTLFAVMKSGGPMLGYH